MDISIIMEEERYNNRQIERMFDEQSKDIKDHMDKVATPILQQVLKTNGRVTRTEDDIIKMKVWRGWMTGGMAVIMVVLPVFVGIATWMLVQILELNVSTNSHIQALDN